MNNTAQNNQTQSAKSKFVKRLTSGTRCELKSDGRKGKIIKAGATFVKGVFNDGTPWEWSRAGFFNDFKY